MVTVTITSRLESVASCGATEISLYVWKSTAKRLSEEDISFKDLGLKSCRKGEGYYLISWKDAEIPDLPANWVLEDVINQRHPSRGQALWLMAQDFNRRHEKKNAEQGAL